MRRSSLTAPLPRLLPGSLLVFDHLRGNAIAGVHNQYSNARSRVLAVPSDKNSHGDQSMKTLPALLRHPIAIELSLPAAEFQHDAMVDSITQHGVLHPIVLH